MSRTLLNQARDEARPHFKKSVSLSSRATTKETCKHKENISSDHTGLALAVISADEEIAVSEMGVFVSHETMFLVRRAA